MASSPDESGSKTKSDNHLEMLQESLGLIQQLCDEKKIDFVSLETSCSLHRQLIDSLQNSEVNLNAKDKQRLATLEEASNCLTFTKEDFEFLIKHKSGVLTVCDPKNKTSLVRFYIVILMFA